MPDDKPTNVCACLDAAYNAFRANPGEDAYIKVLEALEADLREGAFGYLPVREASPEALTKDGKVQWPVTQTPKGKMLSLFTNRTEVERHSAPASIGLKLIAFLREALVGKDLVGILLNPLDGHHGVPIERRNLEVLAPRLQAGRMPQLNPGIVSNAVYRLWDIAVGVPTAVYDVQAEVEKLGGMEKILKPLLDKWQSRAQTSAKDFPEPMDYVRAVLNDVVSSGFVYGAMALKNANCALEVDVVSCIDAIPNLRDDIVQNLDEYLILISDAVRSGLKEPNEAHVQLLVAGNLPIIAFGAFNFGLGWGMAKDAESRGVLALADLRDRQQAWIEKFKRDFQEKVRKGEEERTDEDGE